MTYNKETVSQYIDSHYSAYQTSKLNRQFAEDEATKSFPELNISLLGTTTLEFLKDAITLEGYINSINLKPHILPAEQIMQLTLNPGSDLYTANPKIIIILARIEDLYPAIKDATIIKDNFIITKAKNEILNQIESWVHAIQTHSSASIILHTFKTPDWSIDATNEIITGNSLWRLVQQINLSFYDLSIKFSGIHVVNIERAINQTPLGQWHDPKLWYLGRISFGSKDPRSLIRCWIPIFNEIIGNRKKCLVVDLDNTLWGGVIGEDGLSGIKLGTDYPGNVYKDVQTQILDLWQNGVMLAIASKNNEGDVREVFDNHPEMILKWDHFLVKKINWNDKAGNIVEIANELNIGITHMVFLDDNPVECSQVEQAFPDITILQVPIKNICHYPDILRDRRFFDGSRITEEDKKRNQMYVANIEREAAKPRAKNIDDFLISLKMEAIITSIKGYNLSRSFQMINKTNQFNLTTRRYTETDVKKIYEDKNWMTFSASLKDRFGDNGLVGLVLTNIKNGDAHIDIFLMSCRVISRGLETLMLLSVIDKLRDKGINTLYSEYIPTAKNSLVETFYENHGFELIYKTKDGTKKYCFKLIDDLKFPKHHIQLNIEE